MSTWEPPPYVPARAAVQVCTEATVRQYFTDCMSGMDCAAFLPGGEHAACGECMTPTPIGEARYGPLVLSGIIRETNLAGCIELLGEEDCSVHLQARSVCEMEACFDNCPATDSASLILYDQCRQDARYGTCESYRQAAVCITELSNMEACTGDSFEEALVATGMVFCGQ